jgi:hypothetical protein
MAKKINDQESSEQKPGALASPEASHGELQATRRELEKELLIINSQVRDAITRGDLAALESLQSRQSELPKLFIAASVAETNARHDILNAADAENVAELEAAQAERSKLTIKLAKRQQEVDAEIAELRGSLQAAEGRVNAAYEVVAALRNAGADKDAGFKKSLAALAGV